MWKDSDKEDVVAIKTYLANTKLNKKKYNYLRSYLLLATIIVIRKLTTFSVVIMRYLITFAQA